MNQNVYLVSVADEGKRLDSGRRRKNRNLLGKISLLIFYMKTMI